MFASTSYTSKTASGLNNANLNYLNVYNDANFYGTTTFYGPVNITVPVGFVNLTVTNQTTLNKLTVSGATIFNGPVTFNGTITLTTLTLTNLTVTNNTTLNNLTTTGNTLVSNLSSYSTYVTFGSIPDPTALVVTGDTTFTGAFEQTGLSLFQGQVTITAVTTALVVTSGLVSFALSQVNMGSATVIGNFTCDGPANFLSTVGVVGAVTANVINATTINLTTVNAINGILTGTLSVAGVTTLGILNSGTTTTGDLNSLITVTGSLTAASLTVGGLTALNGAVNILGSLTLEGFVNGPVGLSFTADTLNLSLNSVFGNIVLDPFVGSILLENNTYVNFGSFNVGTTGTPLPTALHGNTSIDNGSFTVGTAIVPTTSNFYGDTHLNLGTFFVGSATTPVAQLWYGAVTFGDPTHLYTFSVYGLANLTTLTVFSTSVMTGLTTCNGGLAATTISSSGLSTLNSLSVTTTSTFTGLATFNGGISISGSITLGALTVTSLTVNTTSTFTGLATFNGGVASTTITSSGLSTLNSLTVTNSSILNGSLTVNGLFFTNSLATFNAGITVSSGGILVSSGGIGVTVGPATFLGNTFNVATGASRATITMYGSAIGGMLFNSAGAITITATTGTTFFGDIIASNLSTFTGLATFNGGITVSGGATINGNTTVNGTLTIGPGGATHDLAVYGTAFLGAVSQAGTANMDRINFNTLWLSGTLPCFASGTWTPILRATAGVSFAYTTQSGFYMNLGQSFFLNITLNATYTGTSAVSIDISLPFTTSTPSSVLIVATDGIVGGTFNPNGIVYMQTFAASGYASLYNPFTLTSYSYSRAIAGSPIKILASVILQN
jgi:fibronectin-binding autotransporter adhesin